MCEVHQNVTSSDFHGNCEERDVEGWSKWM